MSKVIVIVARDQVDLFEYFKRGFASLDSVAVILDRRVYVGGSREGARVEPERRHEIEVYEELQLRGFIIRPAS